MKQLVSGRGEEAAHRDRRATVGAGHLSKPRGSDFPFRLVGVLVAFIVLGTSGLRADDTVPTNLRLNPFDIPAGNAATTLRVFSAQAGIQLLVSSDDVRDIHTPRVQGVYPPLAALQEMLQGTGLEARADLSTGAVAIVRRPASRSPRSGAPAGASAVKAQADREAVSQGQSSATVRPENASSATQPGVEEETIALPQFNVSSSRATDRYRSTDTVSAIRVRGEILDTPQSVTVLGREFLEDVDPVRLYDATRYVAGITEGRGVGFNDRIIVRGYENDGRVVDSFAFNTIANFEEALADRVEVLKGPNTILAPNGSPGGSVNVITKSPKFEVSRVLSLTAGLYDAQKLTLDATGPVGDSRQVAYRLIGVSQDSERYWQDSTLKTSLLAPAITYKFSEHAELTLKYIGAHYSTWGDPRVLIASSVVEGANAEKAPGFTRQGLNGAEPWNHREATYHLAELNVTGALAETVTVRLAAQFWADSEATEVATLALPLTTNRYNPYTGQLTPDLVWFESSTDRSFSSVLSPYYNPENIPRSATWTKAWNEVFQLQNDLAATHRIGPALLTSVTGWYFSHNLNRSQVRNGALPSINLNAPVYGAVPTYSDRLSILTTSQIRSQQWYAVEKIDFQKPRVSLTAGASRFWTNSRATDLLSQTPTATLRDGHSTVLLGAVFKPSKTAAAYYSFSNNATPVLANSTPLWREGRQHEFGFKLSLRDDRLSVTIAHFQIAQTNVPVPNPEFQLDQSRPQTLLSSFKNHGFELELNGGLTRTLSVVGALSLMKTRDNLGRRPRAIADRSGGLFLNYHLSTTSLAGLSLYGGISYTGSAAGDAPPNFTALGVVAQPSFTVPAYTTVTLGSSYSWTRYSLRLTADNALNADYYYSSGARFAVAESPTTNLRLTFSARF